MLPINGCDDIQEMHANGAAIFCFFTSGDPQGLGRDFTYIDDVIDGILASLDYQPSECGERFNLGFGNPVSVPAMVDLLQKELDVPAKVVSSLYRV